MYQDTNQQYEQEQLRIVQGTEQNRINMEMMVTAKPSKNGWKMVVAFLIISIGPLWVFSAKGQTLSFADRNEHWENDLQMAYDAGKRLVEKIIVPK